ncbi:MAG: glycoside hydrolase family 3 N-terminal domain-containing protein [Bacteroidales bacterium]
MLMKCPVKNLGRQILITLLLSFQGGTLLAQDPPFLEFSNHPWVDSVMNTLSLNEKIAQSLWLATWSNRDVSHYTEVTDIIRNNRIGGLLFFQGNAEKQAELVNHYQSVTKVPLTIATDAEWGAGMRLADIPDYPFQMTLGAIRDDSLIYLMGRRIGKNLRETGVTVNLAPVADINNNAANPVINYRSFGESPATVASMASQYSRGLQDERVLATAKHFPGHGDTDTDSHLALPVIRHSRERFDTVELVPFQKMINTGTGAVMTAHLSIPSLDNTPDTPSTLSKAIITGLLKGTMGFRGLVITDAMNMKGVTSLYQPGEAEAMAYIAGNDIIEYVTDIPLAIESIRKKVDEGVISPGEVDARCRKILAMKWWSGAAGFQPIDNNNLTQRLNDNSSKAFIRELYANAMTLLINNNNTIPVAGLDRKRIATVSLNREEYSPFNEITDKYTLADHYFLPEGSGADNNLINTLSGYDLVIAGIFGTDQRPYRNFGLNDNIRSFMGMLTDSASVITVYFGNPYAIDSFTEVEKSNALLLAYQENTYTEELSIQLIFGATGAHGRLPVTINNRLRQGHGIITPGNERLQYGYPESADLSSDYLDRTIDSIAISGLEKGAYPGCEVIIAKNGIVVFHKSYGHHTYDRRIETKTGDIWDIASLTKISAPLPALMKLEEQGLFSTNATLATYSPFFKGSDKGDLHMDELLTHQAGLTAWIPYWKNALRPDGSYRWRSFKHEKSDRYPVEVNDNLYLHRNYKKKIYREIRSSPLGEKRYLYSDLPFFLFPDIIEKLSGTDYEKFINENIYYKLGAFDLVYNPYRYFPGSRIVPTEFDAQFRGDIIHGYVHDEGAAMLGGYSGNAGLFATANDLLKLIEMYRRMGNYGGEQIIAREVMEKYISAPFTAQGNRRALGFDRPQLPEDVRDPQSRYPCIGASGSSFGHSGFTGTFAWADPEYDISYIFLSNRVYPTRDNNLLSELDIRTSILQAVYDAEVKQ